jgi:hypothetical protein
MAAHMLAERSKLPACATCALSARASADPGNAPAIRNLLNQSSLTLLPIT